MTRAGTVANQHVLRPLLSFTLSPLGAIICRWGQQEDWCRPWTSNPMADLVGSAVGSIPTCSRHDVQAEEEQP